MTVDVTKPEESAAGSPTAITSKLGVLVWEALRIAVYCLSAISFMLAGSVCFYFSSDRYTGSYLFIFGAGLLCYGSLLFLRCFQALARFWEVFHS